MSRVVHEQMANQQPQLVRNSHQSNNQLENTLNVYQQGLPNGPNPPLDQGIILLGYLIRSTFHYSFFLGFDWIILSFVSN